MSVLARLVAGARRRARGPRPAGPPAPRAPAFDAAIRGRDRLHVIAEFKRASPSAPALAPGRDVAEHVARYAAAGASVLSVVTEPDRFHGNLDDLRRAVVVTGLPVLMKDFVVAPEQIEAGAHAGASAVLLIVRCLGRRQVAELVAACASLRVTPVVECHDEAEIDIALAHEEAVIGVNNRDLDTLLVDTARARRLLPRVPAHRIAVAESGYATPQETKALRGLADAVLVGSALMRAPDPAAFLREALA